jgi:hypothetical protein
VGALAHEWAKFFLDKNQACMILFSCPGWTRHGEQGARAQVGCRLMFSLLGQFLIMNSALWFFFLFRYCLMFENDSLIKFEPMK